MVFVILADILVQPERTRYMYLLASIPHITTMIAPLFANLFMSINIWIPFAIAMGSLFLGLLVIWAMPESLNIDSANITPGSPGLTSPLLDSGRRDPPDDESQQNDFESPRALRTYEQKPWSKAFADIMVLIRVPGLLFYLGLFFVRPIALISRAFVCTYFPTPICPLSSCSAIRIHVLRAFT